MAEVKNIENATINNGEAANEATNPDKKQAKEPGKIGAFFKKHSGKIKTGLLVAGGIAAGVAVDKFGIRLVSRKKDDDRPAATEADV